MEKKRFTFQEIFKQNKRRIYYHLHKLNIHDPHKAYYQEGLVAMWMAHKNDHLDKGPLSSYFNFIIRRRLIELIKKESLRSKIEVLAASEDAAGFDMEVKKRENATLLETFDITDTTLRGQ